MSRFLDWFTIDEALETVVLILLLTLLAEQVAQPDFAIRRNARRFSAAIFLTYVVLGISEWRPASIGAVLGLVIRACLAAGVGYGVSTMGLVLMQTAVGDPVAIVRRWMRAQALKVRQRTDEARRRRQWKAQDELDRAEELKRGAAMADEQRRQAEEEAKLMRERHSKTDEARAEVIRYYEAHADILYDTLPAALFRTRLQTRFPASIQPDQAWQAAQEMIGEMVPMIATAKGEREQVDQSNRDKAAAIERLQRSIRRLELEQEQIGKTPGFDPDVGEPELRAIRENIRELRDQLESLEPSTSESHV